MAARGSGQFPFCTYVRTLNIYSSETNTNTLKPVARIEKICSRPCTNVAEPWPPGVLAYFMITEIYFMITEIFKLFFCKIGGQNSKLFGRNDH